MNKLRGPDQLRKIFMGRHFKRVYALCQWWCGYLLPRVYPPVISHRNRASRITSGHVGTRGWEVRTSGWWQHESVRDGTPTLDVTWGHIGTGHRHLITQSDQAGHVANYVVGG